LKVTFNRIYGHSVCSKCHRGFALRRLFAYLLDRIIWVLPTLVLGFAVGMVLAATGKPITPQVESTLNLMEWPFFVLFLFKDGFWGYSPGKWLCGVRVIDDRTRQPIGFIAALKRNLPIFIPIVPLIIAVQLQNGKRWGDGWAHSMVIWKKYARSSVFGTPGSCEACQYNLAGNESGICPECGTAVSEKNREFLAQSTSSTPSAKD
jgi:uncharacterized RDD family membrane protein YckC